MSFMYADLRSSGFFIYCQRDEQCIYLRWFCERIKQISYCNLNTHRCDCRPPPIPPSTLPLRTSSGLQPHTSPPPPKYHHDVIVHNNNDVNN